MKTTWAPANASEQAAVMRCLTKAKKCIFVTGAGISTDAGIPDFSMNSKLRGIFDAVTFNGDCIAEFEKLRAQASKAKPTATHQLIAALGCHGRLLRDYTQNLDRLQERAGLDSNLTIMLHGTLAVRCTICNYRSESMAVSELCPRCESNRNPRARKTRCAGVMRPNVALYHEAVDNEAAICRAINADLRRDHDCLVIMGTRMKIPGVQKLIKAFARRTSGVVVLVNRERPTARWRRIIHYWIKSDCDSWANAAIDALQIRAGCSPQYPIVLM